MIYSSLSASPSKHWTSLKRTCLLLLPSSYGRLYKLAFQQGTASRRGIAGLSVLAAGIEDDSGFGGDADEEWLTDDVELDSMAREQQHLRVPHNSCKRCACSISQNMQHALAHRSCCTGCCCAQLEPEDCGMTGHRSGFAGAEGCTAGATGAGAAAQSGGVADRGRSEGLRPAVCRVWRRAGRPRSLCCRCAYALLSWRMCAH